MALISRRGLLGGIGFAGMAAVRDTDIQIAEVRHSYQDFLYRAPYKFGGIEVDRCTLLNVDCVVKTRGGRTARGFGSMTMGNVWSFPSRVLSYGQTLDAMKALAARIAALTQDYKEYGHPIDANVALEPLYLNAAHQVTAHLRLADPIPKLCTLVTASPFDAAIHDAFGKLHHRNCYQTYGPDLLRNDLGHYLGAGYKGEFLNRYVLEKATPRLPLYHSVGASDPIVDADIVKRIDDGLPQTLGDWIRHDGLTHFKIKLNGNDLNWDSERVVRIDRAASEAQSKRGLKKWFYSLDFNERCPNVDYLLDFLARLRERAPAAFDRLQYIEQPTARDLEADRANVMHRASAIKPVIIDESLTGIDRLLLAREMGYTGVALKACKGQSQSLLMSAVAQKHKMFLCVQDLTCPGASLLQSVGLAAHTPGVAGIEANSRQYVPSANQPWEKRFPGVFHITDGLIRTAELNGPGLGAVPESANA
ncbi:MAG: enolase C-terminal domain-like protein [Bryobacteraceae bacterium]